MKVGTDGVLLGAWADVSNSHRVLDIGTGSGLIALMLAQRSRARIDGIDIDAEACREATENVRQSPWPGKVRIINTSLQTFFPKEERYDTIVSNPPFFNHSLPSPDAGRTLARHCLQLNLQELFQNTHRLLTPGGIFSLILPTENVQEATRQAAEYGLAPGRTVYVKPTIICPPGAF